MKPIALALSLVLLVACGGVGAPGTPASSDRQLVVSPTDTALVRRACTAPDSVLAKRAPCVLRADFTGVKKF